MSGDKESGLADHLDQVEELTAHITPEYVRAKLHEALTRQYGRCPGCSGCGGPEEVRDAPAR